MSDKTPKQKKEQRRKREAELGRLYDLMLELSDKHDAEDARLAKKDGSTVNIELEYSIPEDPQYQRD